MADLVGVKSKLNDIEVRVDAAHSEALMNKVGANINKLIDETDSLNSLSGVNSVYSTSHSDSFHTYSGDWVQVANLGMNITTTARPMMLVIHPSNSPVGIGTTPGIYCNDGENGYFRITRNGVVLCNGRVTGGGGHTPTAVVFDAPGSGNHNYAVQVRAEGAGGIWVTAMTLTLVAM